MRFLPANIAGVVIWRRFYRSPRLPFQIAVELLELPVVEEKSAAIHLPVRPEVFTGKTNKRIRPINVERF
jgi:hypothetical protein